MFSGQIGQCSDQEWVKGEDPLINGREVPANRGPFLLLFSRKRRAITMHCNSVGNG
jgi:hypothetical protein